MIDTLLIDDLDGAVTLFKSTDEGTETIAVFDEEHREVIQDLLAEVERLNNIISTFDEFMCQLPQRYTEGTMRLWNELVNKHYLTSFTTFMEMMKND